MGRVTFQQINGHENKTGLGQDEVYYDGVRIGALVQRVPTIWRVSLMLADYVPSLQDVEWTWHEDAREAIMDALDLEDD